MPYLGGFAGLLVTGLWVFCIIDALMSPEQAVRNLPKIGWVLIVLFFPLIGSIAWLVAGRPQEGRANLPYKGNTGQAPWPATRTAGFPEYERPALRGTPNDDVAFLDPIAEEKARSDAEHEDMLRRWEADLRRREEELRRARAQLSGPDSTPGATSPRGSTPPPTDGSGGTAADPEHGAR
jgi:hypothetical protein